MTKRRVTKAAPLDPQVKQSATVQSNSPYKPSGAPGTAIYGGYVLSKEKDSNLSGQNRYITYSNTLANVSIVASGVRFFVNLVAKASWKPIPKDDSKEAERLADLVQEIMDDMVTPWHRVVRRAAMYSFWGFSVQEWTAKKRDDGVIGYKDIAARPQVTIERWDTDVNGNVLGMIQVSPQDYTDLYLPRSKVIYVVDDALNDSPEGMGLFRHIVKTAERLQRYELLEAWGFESDLRGIPIARGPFTMLEQMVNTGQLTTAQATALKQPMVDFLESHNRNPELGMLLDSMPYVSTDESQTPSTIRQWDVELLQGSPGTASEVANAIERLNREIARILGVEHLLLGSGSGGSFAMAKDKSEQFGLLVDSCLKELKEVMEKDFLGPLWELNGWDKKLMPTFRVEKIQYRDVQQIASALQQMAQAGAPLAINDPAINEVRDLLGLSDMPDQEVLDPDLSLLPTLSDDGPVGRGERNPDPVATPEPVQRN